MNDLNTKESLGSKSPIHVAIIMDGNGRWASSRGLPRIEGHRNGAESVREAIRCAIKYNIQYLTLYSFSSENWNRPKDEINDLMGLLRHYLRTEIHKMGENDISLRVIGDRSQLSDDIVNLIEESENATRKNKSLTLIIALSYGGRKEITAAARALAENAVRGNVHYHDITEDVFSSYLQTRGIPDPDLLIRTSGEKRISNFLLWQLAYSELVFIDTLWPDFRESDFVGALAEFSRRERRFGAFNG